MRRNVRLNNKEGKSLSDKIIMYSGIGVAVLAVIVIGLLMYSKSLSDDVKNSTMSLEDMASIVGNTTQDTESASTEIGKSVEEAQNEISQNEANQEAQNTTNQTNTTSITEKKINSTNTQTSNTANKTTTTNKTQNTTTNSSSEETSKKELSFERPVEGDIVREYTKDSLIYSETLQEWTTHTGIDIKADKTTVVKAAEAGTVKSIKNDPRYGLTIVIEHDEHFQTVYSNLLTSEFVVEGEKVEKGQSIGTVGNTAVFEIADEPHLHFEILKDNLPEDPSIYIK